MYAIRSYYDIGGKAASLRDGVALAAELIDTHLVADKLEEFKKASNRF